MVSGRVDLFRLTLKMIRHVSRETNALYKSSAVSYLTKSLLGQWKRFKFWQTVNPKAAQLVLTRSHIIRGVINGIRHGLRTPNEGITQRYLKNWADVADKICCRRT